MGDSRSPHSPREGEIAWSLVTGEILTLLRGEVCCQERQRPSFMCER